MRTQEAFIIEDGVEVPESAFLRVERSSRGYGSVPGLEDGELASPAELERQMLLAEWGPILSLPVKKRDSWIRPNIDENGDIDWGAFGTVDFKRIVPEFDKARYKADRLQEKLRNDLIILDVVRERVKPEARAAIRRLALHTQADLDDIENYAEWAYGRWLRHIRDLSREIRDLRNFSRQRRLSSAWAAV